MRIRTCDEIRIIDSGCESKGSHGGAHGGPTTGGCVFQHDTTGRCHTRLCTFKVIAMADYGATGPVDAKAWLALGCRWLPDAVGAWHIMCAGAEGRAAASDIDGLSNKSRNSDSKDREAGRNQEHAGLAFSGQGS